MKKILIIGAGIEQVPAIKIAKQMGYYVVTTDFNPSAPGMSFADKSFVISTNDKEKNLEVAIQEKVDGVMAICSETAVSVVGHICDQLGLKGLSASTAIQSTNKGAMRIAMQENNVAMPPRRFISSLEEAANFVNEFAPPWVLKPSDSSGQRGTNLIYDKKELEWSFNEAKKHSTDNMVLIDQFIEGQEINVNAIVINGEFHILSLADRNTLEAPHFGIAVLHIAPPNITKNEALAVKELAKNAANAIGLRNGIAYPQIIVTKNGPKLIEIAARMPGGYNREMAQNLSGIDMIKAQILSSINDEFKYEELIESPIFKASGVKLLTSIDYPELVGKKIKSIDGIKAVEEMEGVQACHFHVKIGDIIPSLENSVGRFAAIIAIGDSKTQVLNRLETAKEKIKINVH